MKNAKKWIVYKHQNLINNKIYIGITSQQPEERWKQGKGYKLQTYFYRAINKYGWDNFSHEILFTNLSYEKACELEQQLINQFNSNKPTLGYNLTSGGEGIKGYSHTEKTKQQISLSMKKLDHSEKTQRLSKWNKEHRKEHSDLMSKRWADEEFKKNMSEKHQKKVICVNTGEIFNSINEAAKYAGITPTGISKCLKGIQKTAGKHPLTKEKLIWKYV